jgi:hypothetical protein
MRSVKICFTLIALLFTLGGSVGLGAPMTFDEISFLVRIHESDASIVSQISERRLLRAPTPEQEAALKKQGVSETLMQTLRDPKLVVDEAEAAAFEKRRNERKALAAQAAAAAAAEAAEVDSVAPAAQAEAEAETIQPTGPGTEPVTTGRNLVIDRIRMIQHPIPTPYYVYLRVQEGQSEAVYENRKTAFGAKTTGDLDVEIPINIVLKDIHLNSWASITLQLDTDADEAQGDRPLKKHTTKFQIREGSQRKRFVPQLFSPSFVYEIYYHTSR